jgi:two-component system, OmpR family, response regulator ChvI
VTEEIQFTGSSQNCCVCFVDAVDSTKITVEISNSEKIKRYYSIFINTMAAIVRNSGANIIKNTGDSLIYYFPKTSDPDNMPAFKGVLECGLTMIAINPLINAKLQEKLLPSLYYRISADYGRVEIAKSLTSTSEDLFGPTVSICAKINSMAAPNQMVIGSDLYQIVEPSFGDDYIFNQIDEYSIDNHKHRYPIYSARYKNNNKNNDDTLNLYRNVIP